MVGEHSRARADAGEHALTPARIAGKKVRLDKALRQQQIRLDGKPVDNAGAARRQRADACEHGDIVAVMDIDFLVLHDVRAELGDKLIARCLSVTACRNQDGDVRIRVAAPHLGEHLRDNHLRRDGAGMVACKNHNFFLAARKLGKRCCADGMLHRAAHQRFAVRLRRIGMQPRGQHGAQARVRQVEAERCFAKRKFKMCHRNASVFFYKLSLVPV